MVLASFLAGTAYMHSFTMQAAWTVLPSFHFTLWSLIHFYWSRSMFLCTRRLFKQFSLGRKPSMHECHLTFKLKTGCCKLYQILLSSLGTLSILLVPLEVAASEWQWICCKQWETTSKGWRCHWAAAHVVCQGMAAAPHFLQRIWNCSAIGPGSHLFRNAKQTKADQTWEVRM